MSGGIFGAAYRFRGFVVFSRSFRSGKTLFLGVDLSKTKLNPVGYGWLIRAYGLRVIEPVRRSFVAARGVGSVERTPQHETHIYPPGYGREAVLGEQLGFALRYEGVNLSVLDALFAVVDQGELIRWIGDRPTGKYARRAWFLYEWLTDRRLALPDLEQAAYIDVLDPDRYHTATPRRISRQRVRDNLPGVRGFCPLVRRTEALEAFDRDRVDQRCRDVLRAADPKLLARAVDYLFTKETKSSFAIERETPGARRTQRFVATLARAEHDDYFNDAKLVALQNEIVEPRFAEPAYRSAQNYVGQTIGWTEEKVHYVCPRPGDVQAYMNQLIACHHRIDDLTPHLHPVVHAATIAFGFVYIHPFEDGNGRIHRFLIHHVLSRRGFTPSGLVLPVSAAMLDASEIYDQALEAFSRPLMELVDYELDEAGKMTVSHDTAAFYRYPDLTVQAETLAGFVTRAVDVDLVGELEFLRNYDAARIAVRDVVDLPDKLLDLCLNLLRQNGGTLSKRKREQHFAVLTDEEVVAIEAAFAAAVAEEGPARPAAS